MRMSSINFSLVMCFLFIGMLSYSCSSDSAPPEEMEEEMEMEEEEEEEEEIPEGANVSQIDLSNWKVTLPFGSPSEVEPPEILKYWKIEELKSYMYDDVVDSSLVFFTEPGSSTQNSSYSRTELREQISPGSNDDNWTFPEGGTMRGTLRLENISTKTNGEFHRTIIMQIHGRLTNEQRDLIGQDDNNAPPVLKIYWEDGKIDVRRKVLKDLEVSDIDLLKKEAWEDESFVFDKVVNNEKFTIDVIAGDGYLKVSLNDDEESVVWDDIHMEKWNVFENYFKAGNYLQTSTAGAFATVRYYSLEVNH